MKKIGNKKLTLLTAIILGLLDSTANADFLDMPDVVQSRDVEQKTLLRDLDIPGVKDRSPDPTAGPRLAVSEFRIQGLVEYPELGITRQALAELVESIRFELMSEGKLLESGYTIEELGELSDLLVEIEEETQDRHVTPLEVQKLVWLIRDQRGKRGVTLGQIDTVANKITNFYRERGFILAKAYIPKQRVRDGVVNLTLLLGALGEVAVNGNDLYSVKTLQNVFGNQLTKPVTNQVVEENLFIINSFPGVTVEGYFEPGYQVGDTRLNINVKDERWWNANVRFDSHGTKESGLYRFYADFQVNNLLGAADFIHVALLNAASPNNTTYGQFDFETNLFHHRLRGGFDVSQNQFVVDQSVSGINSDLHGEVDVQGLTLRYISQRSRTRNSNYEFRFEQIASDLTLGTTASTTSDEEIQQTSLKYSLDILDDKNKRLHDTSIKYTLGKYLFGAEQGQSDTYEFINANYTLLTFMKVPFTDTNSRLILRTNLQYAGKNLSSIARFSLAGPTRARGFSPSFFTADDALYFGADWVFNSPGFLDFEIGGVNIKELTKPFLFVDFAYGRQISVDPTEDDSQATLADVGFGLQFSRGHSFSGNLIFAFPVKDELRRPDQFGGQNNTEPEVDSVKVLVDFQYSF